MSGERDLWCAVLSLAIDDAVTGARVNTHSSSLRVNHTEEARHYITTPSEDLALVCGLLGVDMEALTERMAKRIAAAPAPADLLSRRRSQSKTYEVDGERLSAGEWADRYGVSDNAVRARMRKGLSPAGRFK